jgi:outer membrane lipoprotein-sorting protein
MNKLSLLLAVSLFTAATFCYGQNADSIVSAARNRIDADTILTQAKMTLKNRNGRTSERVLNQYSKDDAAGNDRIIIEFISPKPVHGIRFLTINKKSGDDDRWIYLPALGKIRRVSSSEGGSSFQGTDFSYDDLSSTDRDANEDVNSILRSETLAGHDCYVAQSIPKDKNYQYSKILQWIDKENSMIWKMELYDENGALKKVFEVKKVKDIPSVDKSKAGKTYLTPMESVMTTVRDNTSTTIEVMKIRYDARVPESAFTTRYLETGKAR